MLSAFLERDPTWDGVFYTGVVTTGIFCRPTCPARKPRPENLQFFPTAREALQAGYRPCRRCRPVEPAGTPPEWLRPLLDAVESEPERRWRDADLHNMGLHPERVRRWFQRYHGMSFHAYCRARRLGLAMGRLRERLATPIGTFLAGATEEALCLLEFADRRQLETQLTRLQRKLRCRFLPARNEVIGLAEHQLGQYFRGERRRFDIPLELAGTPFQETVWRALLEIPYGATESYAELARRIGRPTAVRAVARSNGDNRIPIIIPCHRVIGADGRLTGYGGGLWRKQRLLELESGETPVRRPVAGT